MRQSHVRANGRKRRCYRGLRLAAALALALRSGCRAAHCGARALRAAASTEPSRSRCRRREGPRFELAGGLPEPLIENYHARSFVRHTGGVRLPSRPLQSGQSVYDHRLPKGEPNAPCSSPGRDGRKRRRLWDTQSMIQRPKIGVRGGADGWCQARAEAAASLGHPVLARPRTPATRPPRYSISLLIANCTGVMSSRSKSATLSAAVGFDHARSSSSRRPAVRLVRTPRTRPRQHSGLARTPRRRALDEFAFPSRIDHAKHISTRQ
jgi:hypothetical protein